MTATTEPGALNPQKVEKFTRRLALALAILVILPAVVGFVSGHYTGSQYNLDDHMVYAAWMHQAKEGHFLFENRFTTDPQPGLTVHLYFWLLGLLSKGLGIPVVVTLARAGFSYLFVLLVGRLVQRLSLPVAMSKLSVTLAALGGGIGFLSWQTLGVHRLPGTPDVTFGLDLGRLAADVWQPEIFAFPSMLTNSLFMVSLCLMLLFCLSVLDAETSWKPVLGGGLAFGLLMNIHSYDVLLLTLVCVGFLAAQLASKRFTWLWAVRALVMGLFALPAAAWFMYVLRNDPVFQARAATETFSPNFRTLFFGLLPGLVFLATEFFGRGRSPRARVGAGVFVVGLGILFAAAGSHLKDEYWMGWPAFLVALCAAILVVAMVAREENPTWNLLASWSVIGIVAPYFPALFQRKLAAGLAIPICMLAAAGIYELIQRGDRHKRNLFSAVVVVVFAGSSVRWFFRELTLLGQNMSNTTMHAPLVSDDAWQILNKVESLSTPVVAAPGGVAGRIETGETVLYLPDLNPILVGLGGAKAYAAHWSETPRYAQRRGEIDRAFRLQAPADAIQFFRGAGIQYVVVPNPQAYPNVFTHTPEMYGDVIYAGNQLSLVKIP